MTGHTSSLSLYRPILFAPVNGQTLSKGPWNLDPKLIEVNPYQCKDLLTRYLCFWVPTRKSRLKTSPAPSRPGSQFLIEMHHLLRLFSYFAVFSCLPPRGVCQNPSPSHQSDRVLFWASSLFGMAGKINSTSEVDEQVIRCQ